MSANFSRYVPGPNPERSNPPYSYVHWAATAPSCGAGTAALRTPPQGVSSHTLPSSAAGANVERRYVLYVPALYKARPSVASPLVLEFPGTDDEAERQQARSLLNATSEQYGFLYATLQGVDRNLNVGADARAASNAGADDIEFVRQVIAHIRTLVCVDERRVYATGFSRGARFSSRLASELSGSIAAIGAVSGLRYPRPNNASRAVPVIGLHGLADQVNPYLGGGPSYWRTGVPDALGRWVAHNGCNPVAAQQVTLTAHVSKVTYSECVDHADVELVTIKNGGHRWPSGCLSLGPKLDHAFGLCSTEVQANQLLWEFFYAHPMPLKPTLLSGLPQQAESFSSAAHAVVSALTNLAIASEARSPSRSAFSAAIGTVAVLAVGALLIASVFASRKLVASFDSATARQPASGRQPLAVELR